MNKISNKNKLLNNNHFEKNSMQKRDNFGVYCLRRLNTKDFFWKIFGRRIFQESILN